MAKPKQPDRKVVITKKAGTHEVLSTEVSAERKSTGRHQHKAPKNPEAKNAKDVIVAEKVS